MKIQIVAALIALLTLTGTQALAQNSNAAEIRDRMLKRLDSIAELKGKGAIGENNAGYLQAVSGNSVPAQAEVVEQENADRKRVYEAIAKKQGTTAELVGQRRAVQIAEQAKPGEYVMTQTGEWRKK